MRAFAAALLLCVMSQSVLAADTVRDRIAERIQSFDSRLSVESVSEAPMAGLYEVVLSSGEVLYTDDKAEYILAGELYQIQSGNLVSLTEERLKDVRVKALAGIPAEQRVIFPAKGERKAHLQVFTDVDCGYCRKLHDEVAKLNDMGVQVDYLAFPRGGARSAAAAKMSAIWCAEGDERRALMTRAKNGENLKPVACDNPVMEQFAIGQQLGVTGTPALVLDDGRLLPGYLPAEQLAKVLGL
ncbi:Thiol:disulfide interchange protein DsbC [Marinobacterium lacunae]|uniref:Thiol:disulfide interchange protein n=1 Tax=Marinobacterium lacunae TaxID=1232683 RepID=A0A081G2D7_9GAMM|nr:DsbC family protein [Marinobacterium lacunae]KEA64942.1 Thiol:disulfide interchange protein DsbC [Marinobacterium lacunae]